MKEIIQIYIVAAVCLIPLTLGEDTVLPATLQSPVYQLFTRASCDNRECDQRCRRIGYTGGICVNGRCKCDINYSSQEALGEPDNKLDSQAYEVDRASCDNRECNQRCRRIGFTGGVCVNGRCKCDINYSTQETLVEPENKLELLANKVDRASCDNRECDQSCRRIGFTGGVCVNGRCKCDINYSSKEALVESDNKLELLANKVDRASCDNRECNQRCRRIGFTGGVCVNGRCKCDINYSTQETLVEPENKLELLANKVDRASCDNRECDQSCRRIGFTGGVCVNGRCKCDINYSTQEALVESDKKLELLANKVDRASCDNQECNQRCRRIGFTGGVCVNGRCKCDINYSTQGTLLEPENKLELLANKVERASCDNRECDQSCRRIGFTGGVCVNGRCKCDINYSTQETLVDPENKLELLANKVERAPCDNRECDQSCRRIGFTGGVCVNGRCKCDINYSTRETLVDPENKLELLANKVERASCDNRECNQRCRRIGYTGGICVNGRCKCDINYSTQEALGEPDNNLDSQAFEVYQASCDNRECNQRCRRLGFTGGVCVNGRCKCDNFFGQKILQQSQYKPISSNQVYELSCDNKSCSQLCRKIGFKDGVCANNQCICDILAPGVVNTLELPLPVLLAV